MTLLGPLPLLLFGVLAVVMPVACLTLWGRVPGPEAVRTVGRLGLVVAAQLAALLFAGVVLNDYGTFYTSWSELLGSAGGSTTTSAVQWHRFGVPGEPGLSVPVPGAAPTSEATPSGDPTPSADPTPESLHHADWKTLSWSTEAQWPERGAIVSTRLTGATTGLAEDALVYLPPSYFGPGPGARRLPVVEVLTGYPGHAENLVKRLHYPDLLLSALGSGQAAPMVLVMLQPAPTYPWDTECTDVPRGPRAFSFLSRDVPDAVAARFDLQPTDYGAIGDSTGGYCATKLAMLDPTRFSATATLSGYFAAATDRSTRGIFKHDQKLRDLNDLGWRLEHLPAPKVSVLVATAADAPGNDGYEPAQRWLNLVRAPMTADELVLDHGGHNFATFLRQIPDALSWLSRHLSSGAQSGSVER